MSLRFQLERLAQSVVDFCFMVWPQPKPDREKLLACRLISHRGEHDNREVRENTLEAFARAVDAGVWGIEFDLRWTRDLEPVVIHDPDTRRVFGEDIRIAELDFDELRRRLPDVPSLAQVVERFGGSAHMMIELKRDQFDRDEAKAQRLAQVLAELEPGRDYHILALAPELFAPAAFAGKQACVLVAELNTASFSRIVQQDGYGGLCGHYLLINRSVLRRHHQRRQKLGTGFPVSRSVFYRELNRGVDWIFSNQSVRFARLRAEMLRLDD